MNPFLRKLAVVFGAFVAGAIVSSAAPNTEDAAPPPAPILSTEMSGRDLTFFTEAAPRVSYLIQLADLASKRAVTPEIQAEAATVSKEQSATAAKLKALATHLRVSLSDNPDIDIEAKSALQKLEKLKGVKFDKFFLDSQADAQDLLETTLKSAVTSSNSAIKSFAGDTLNTLKQEKARLRMLGL